MLKLILILLLFSFISPIFSQTISRPTGATNGILSPQLSMSGQANVLTEPFEGQHFRVNDDMGGVEGNPFLFSEWKSGEVTLKNGEKYKIEKINLDASRNQFIYSIHDTLFDFSDNVQEIKIYKGNQNTEESSDMIFRSDINPLAANFVEILVKGKITIFREYNKKPEGENYSNGIVNNTRKYVLHSNYYSIKGNKAVPIKFNSSTFDDLTLDKKDQANAFIKKNNLKLKTESDFLKAVAFYNSLPGN
ncbi:MAG: hypothetical protein ABI834_04935 [Ginsengibacter sp.]